MKVLDLQCAQAHVFEGWFGSEDDYQSQRQRGLLECPLCGDAQIEKRLSAPRLNLGAKPVDEGTAQRGVGSPALPAAPPSGAPPAGWSPQLQAAWLAVARKVMAHTEDVGAGFAQEARRIHHGDAPERAIRGQATPQEAVALIEEGIDVLPLPLPAAAKETLQ